MTTSDTIVLKSGKKAKKVAISDIAYIICNCSICDVHFMDGTDFTCAKPLHYFEEVLPPESFFRISHNCIVCMERVSEVTTVNAQKHFVTLQNDTNLNISYRKWRTFRDRYFSL